MCVALCKVGSDVWAQARHCAHSAGDQVFAKDIHRLHCFVTLISTAFKVKVLDAAVHKGGVKYSERACTVQNCKVLRSFMNAYKDFEESTVQEENAQQVAGNLRDELQSIARQVSVVRYPHIRRSGQGGFD